MSGCAGVTGTIGVEHRLLQVGGGPLSVYLAGPDDAPVVVLLHGAMCDESRFVWDQLFPQLAGEFRVVAIDTPRHGASRPWSGHLGRKRLLGILHSGLEELQLPDVAIVGLSMGGGLAIDYAATHPDRVRAMVLFEPGGLTERLDRQFVTWLYTKLPGTGALVTRRYATASHERLRRLLDSLYVGGSQPTDPDRLVGILRDELQRKRRFRERDLDDWQLDAIGPNRLRWNLLDRLPRLRCPTLWLRGAESTLVTQPQMGRAVDLARQGGSHASLVVIPNAGHLLPLERPGQANAAVLEFLRAVSVPFTG